LAYFIVDKVSRSLIKSTSHPLITAHPRAARGSGVNRIERRGSGKGLSPNGQAKYQAAVTNN